MYDNGDVRQLVVAESRLGPCSLMKAAVFVGDQWGFWDRYLVLKIPTLLACHDAFSFQPLNTH